MPARFLSTGAAYVDGYQKKKLKMSTASHEYGLTATSHVTAQAEVYMTKERPERDWSGAGKGNDDSEEGGEVYITKVIKLQE